MRDKVNERNGDFVINYNKMLVLQQNQTFLALIAMWQSQRKESVSSEPHSSV